MMTNQTNMRRRNKKNAKVFCCLILCVAIVTCLYSSLVVCARNNNNEYLVRAKEVIKWKKSSLDISKKKDLFSNDFLKDAGTSTSDWYAIALGRLGLSDSYYAYLAVIEKNIVERYQSKSQLDRVRATEWHRIGLAILSCGGDPTQLKNGTINLIEDGSYNRGKKMPLGAQGDNALFWGLILMDGMRYKVPEQAVDNREKLTHSILGMQKPDGGFAFGENSSPDATGMALQALAPYYNGDGAIRVAIDQAVNYLSKVQQLNGRFFTGGEENGESIVQVIIGLCSLGIDPASDPRFVKDGHSLVQALLSFQQPDGGFGHLSNQGKSDSIASEQALLALTALERFDKRMHNLYDFRNEPNVGIKEMILDLDTAIEELGDKPEPKKVKELYDNYLVIPPEERSYVRKYNMLADAMCTLSLPKKDESFWTSMNQNTGGRGYIIRLQDETEISSDTHFTNKDKELVLSLPQTIKGENEITYTVLLGKLQRAENRKDYKSVEDNLLKIEKEQFKGEAKNNEATKLIIVVVTLAIVLLALGSYKYWNWKQNGKNDTIV